MVTSGNGCGNRKVPPDGGLCVSTHYEGVEMQKKYWLVPIILLVVAALGYGMFVGIKYSQLRGDMAAKSLTQAQKMRLQSNISTLDKLSYRLRLGTALANSDLAKHDAAERWIGDYYLPKSLITSQVKSYVLYGSKNGHPLSNSQEVSLYHQLLHKDALYSAVSSDQYSRGYKVNPQDVQSQVDAAIATAGGETQFKQVLMDNYNWDETAFKQQVTEQLQFSEEESNLGRPGDYGALEKQYGSLADSFVAYAYSGSDSHILSILGQ